MPRQSDSRQRMLESAARLLRRQGYAATGWRQVVAEADAPWGSQAHHFPRGKRQLAEEALTAEASRVRGELAAALADAHPADMVLSWGASAAERLAASGWTTGCPIATTALETAHESPELAKVCDEAFVSWQAELTAAIRTRGLSRKDATGLAALVVASTEGALLLARTAHDTAPLTTVCRELASVLRARVPS